MGYAAYKRCKGCGKRADEVGELSWTRQCKTCWESRFEGNMEGMLTMTGPYAQHWRRRMAASVGAVLLDEPPRVVQGDGSGC